MRNLKRVLALALSLATVLGLMVITSSAASAQFPDADEISYTEAVDVMNGMGILVGDENGNFNPTDILTREQAAKIISYLVIGSEFADQLAGLGTGTFTDVAADRWSAGYIDYCANVGIIAGNGDGTFNPEGELTGVAFAKMLLVAMGNDAEEKGYVGNNWTTNVALDAFNAKINISGISLNENVSREQAAQMAFSALRSDANGYSTSFVVKNGDNVVVYKGTDALTALALAQVPGNTLTTSISYDGGLGAIYGLTESTDTDEFGRVSKTWTNGEEGKDKVVYSAVEPTAVKTYNAETKVSAIAADLGATATKNVTLNVIQNGVAGNTIVANKDGDTDEENPVVNIGGQGTLIEVYKNGDEYDVIVIETFVKALTKDDITKADPDKNQDASITLEAGLTFKTDAFKEGDVVLYTKGTTDGTADTAKIANVVKADSVTGNIDAVGADNAYIKIDGVQYKAAANIQGALGAELYALGQKGNTYYLDNNNNVIYAAAAKADNAPVENKYVYVIATAAKGAGNDQTEGDDLFNPVTVAGSAAVAQAQIIDLATGEIKVVNVAVVKGTDGKYYYANNNGAVPANDADKVEVTGDGTAVDVKAIYTYNELDDGSYVLGVAAETEDQAVLAQNKADVTITNGEGAEAETSVKLATSTTVVTVVEYETNNKGAITSAAVTTYTGIANLPKDGLTLANALVKANDDGIVSSITVVQQKVNAPKAEPATYAVYVGQGESVLDKDGNIVTLHAFYVNGEKVEYYAGENFGTPNAKDVVKLTVTDNKAATAEVAATASNAKVTYVDETFFIAGGQVYYYADGAVIVDEGANYAAATLAKDDVVTVYTNNNNAAEFVLIAK